MEYGNKEICGIEISYHTFAEILPKLSRIPGVLASVGVENIPRHSGFRPARGGRKNWVVSPIISMNHVS